MKLAFVFSSLVCHYLLIDIFNTFIHAFGTSFSRIDTCPKSRGLGLLETAKKRTIQTCN
jgi:hypothetical protein